MLKRGLRYIGMFLIYIIITATVYSAVVFAQFAVDTLPPSAEFTASVSGYDGIPGFRKPAGDVTIVTATAQIEGEAIWPSQVKILEDPTKPFECDEGNTSNPVNCSLTLVGDVPSGAYDFTVRLFRKDGSDAAPAVPLRLYIDDIDPTIHSFSLIRNGSILIVEFQVSDRACEDCPPDVCAGIDRIEILSDYSIVGTHIPENKSKCIIINQTQITVLENQGTLNKTICVDAYDMLSRRTRECKSILLDFSPPKLINASILVNGAPLLFTKNEPIGGATVEAYIYEDGLLNTSSLVADFASLNSRPEFFARYENIDMSPLNIETFDISCTPTDEENIYNCSWNNLLLLIPPDADPEVHLTVMDEHKNNMDDRYPLNIIFDGTRPDIHTIRSGLADDIGRYWVGKGNNTIYFDITEDGAGFYNKNLIVDFGSFGPQESAGGQTISYPNYCIEGWTCVFEYLTVAEDTESGKILSVSVQGLSTDDAGNLVEGMTSTALYYDAVPPQILSIDNGTVCPTMPDSIKLIINVSEKGSGGVSVEYSATDLSTSIFPQIVDCEEIENEQDMWTCEIEIDNIVSFYVEGSINLTLRDRAGNKNSTIVIQEVCEPAPGTPPNVVRSIATGIPDPLDKILAGYIPYPVFGEVKLQYSDPPNKVQGMKIISCSSTAGTVIEPYILTPFEFKNPILGFKLSFDQENLTEIDELEVTCELDLIVRSGNKVYHLPEKENVTIPFGLSGTIFGGLNQSIQDKLDGLEEDIEATQKEIDGYSEVWDVLQTICTIAEVLAMLVALLQVMKIVMYGVGWVVFSASIAGCCIGTLGTGCGGPGTACYTAAMIAGSVVYYIPCWAIDYATTSVTTFAWQIDSNPMSAYDSPGFYLKVLCMFVTCRMSETSNFIEMISNGGTASGGSYTFTQGGRTQDAEPTDLQKGGASLFVDVATGGGATLFEYDWSPYKSVHVARQMYCMPGLIYNARKKQQIQCMHRNCYRDFVSSGFSPELCDKMYATHECLYYDSAAWKMVGEKGFAPWFQGIMEWLLSQMIVSLIAWFLRSMNCGYPQGLGAIADSYTDDDANCGGVSIRTDAAFEAQALIYQEAWLAAWTLLFPPSIIFTAPTAAAKIAEFGSANAAVASMAASSAGICALNQPPTCALIQGTPALGCGAIAAAAIWLDVGDWLSWEDIDWNKYDDDLGDPDYCS